MGLPAKYAVDPSRLEQGYRDLQSRVHPDRFAAATDADRRLAMQWATRANEAYSVLKDPLERARYLLQLKGYDTEEETNTAMPPDFLMQQMEWREAVAEARGRSDAAKSWRRAMLFVRSSVAIFSTPLRRTSTTNSSNGSSAPARSRGCTTPRRPRSSPWP